VGRHSSGSQFRFYRSVFAWIFPWLLVAGLLGVGIWIGVDALSNEDEIVTPPVAAVTSVSPSPTPATPSEDPEPELTPSDEPSDKPSDKPSPKESEVALITENMTVQVLNGTGTPSADELMADRLAQLGFDVVALGGSSKAYSVTTVFWSYTESQEAAEALAEKEGWAVSPKPSNLSTTVALHVVVGDDFL
jgi:hypothetical protein